MQVFPCALSRNFNTIDKVFTVIVLDSSTLRLLHTIPHEGEGIRVLFHLQMNYFTENNFSHEKKTQQGVIILIPLATFIHYSLS